MRSAATQQVVSGTVCGPALVRIEGFRPIHGEVLFVEMEPEEGEYEPWLGYIPLESAVRPWIRSVTACCRCVDAAQALLKGTRDNLFQSLYIVGRVWLR